MQTAIIGIDCATLTAKVGLALATQTAQGLVLKQARVAGAEEEMLEQLAVWMSGRPRVLIALDAPLGWPEPLGRLLAAHLAGEPLGEQPNRLFRRETDRYIKQRLGKLPLDVGADRIARTAHAALALLAALRQRSGEPIPLVWSAAYTERVGAIEVYPAGTLSAAGVRSSGYKEPGKVAQREEIIAWLATQLEGATGQRLLAENADVLDAAICLVAGRDFLQGRAMAPPSLAQAKKEGWIWVRGKR